MSATFNPLDKIHLAESIERALLAQPPAPLPPGVFEGAGIYAIYYAGPLPIYGAIAEAGCLGAPIYVGKAVPAGGRRGGFLTAEPGRSLLRRLGEHAESISANEQWSSDEGADGLRLADFSCKFLLLDDIWIPLGEAILISRYQPVWNAVVDGFGKHASGKGRAAGKRSLWDELHPGRDWALREQPAKLSREQVEHLVVAHLEGRATADDDIDEGQLDVLTAIAAAEEVVEPG